MTYSDYFKSMDIEKLKNHLTLSIREHFSSRKFMRAIVGLSGGLDSSVVLSLASEALGNDNIYAFFMPYAATSSRSSDDAAAMAEITGVHYAVIPITEQIDAYFRNEGNDKVRIGNKCARERMAILYDQSQKLGALVIGTGNKSEMIMGYSTVFGDTACAVNPLGHLYKTAVRNLARALKVPEQIINKPPSADLWEGQTDEKEMNLTYDEIDAIAYLYFDKGLSVEEIEQEGFSRTVIERILSRYRATRYKYELPLIIPLNE